MIESKTNDKIKYLEKLRSKKYRDKENLFIVEGYHLVEEAYKRGLLKEVYSVCEENYDVPNFVVKETLLNTISALQNNKIIGIVKKQQNQQIGKRIIALDGVQDPGNLGTIIRTAIAFNFDTLILSENCVDLYNDKVIRSTQGLMFDINIIRMDLKKIITSLSDYEIYVTDVKKGMNINDIKASSKYVLILGSEGEGVSEDIKKYATKIINIKTSHNTESLNVAVAGAIIMHKLGDFYEL